MVAAGLVWTLAGLGLLVFGAYRMCGLRHSPQEISAILAISVVAGLFKGRFVLGKVAARNVERIRSWGVHETRCIGGFQPLRSWLLVIAMIAMGRFLRSSPLPRELVWGVYVAVGTALFVASKYFWEALFGMGDLNLPGP